MADSGADALGMMLDRDRNGTGAHYAKIRNGELYPVSAVKYQPDMLTRFHTGTA
ncbi:hypothetical protein KAURM247S_01031 [Kitasatospora aureofaciens]